MTSTHLALAAALIALAAPALASDGDQGPAPGRAQVFALAAPRLDLGSEAYLSTTGLGAVGEQGRTATVVRTGVPAYQHGVDTGAETAPAAF
jgi:hypothetical protein